MENTILSGSLTRSNPLTKLDLGRFGPHDRHGFERSLHGCRALGVRLSLCRQVLLRAAVNIIEVTARI